jgi:hypothetical protein
MRYYHLSILALSGFVTSFGAQIVATNLPSYAEVAGVGALTIGLLVVIYNLVRPGARCSCAFDGLHFARCKAFRTRPRSGLWYL